MTSIRRLPPRFFAPVAMALLVALVSASCGSLAPYAAELGHHRLPDSALDRELSAIAGNSRYVSALQSGGQIPRAQGDGGPGTWDSGFVAYVLTNEIAYGLVHLGFVRRHLSIGPGALAGARAELLGVPSGAPSSPTQRRRSQIFEAFPPYYRTLLVRRAAEARTLRTALQREFFDHHPAEVAQTCVSHILLSVRDAQGGIDAQASLAQARAVEARLAAGEDFATVATAVSTDPGSAKQGGDLGCTTPDHYVAAFRDAVERQAVGVVGPPVPTEFGVHIIKVTKRTQPTFEQYRQQLAQNPRAVDRLETFFEQASRQTRVVVNPKYGRFDPQRLQVVPPTGPSPARGLYTPTPTTAPPLGPGAGLTPAPGG
ncbi:MAG: peptidylprolyl isomerase [Acidimicrobiales bacterium]